MIKVVCVFSHALNNKHHMADREMHISVVYTCCVCGAVGCTTCNRGQEKVGNKGQMKAEEGFEVKVEGKWGVLHCLGMWYVDVTLLRFLVCPLESSVV
jgi:hypothetical protein